MLIRPPIVSAWADLLPTADRLAVVPQPDLTAREVFNDAELQSIGDPVKPARRLVRGGALTTLSFDAGSPFTSIQSVVPLVDQAASGMAFAGAVRLVGESLTGVQTLLRAEGLSGSAVVLYLDDGKLSVSVRDSDDVYVRQTSASLAPGPHWLAMSATPSGDGLAVVDGVEVESSVTDPGYPDATAETNSGTTTGSGDQGGDGFTGKIGVLLAASGADVDATTLADHKALIRAMHPPGEPAYRNRRWRSARGSVR